MRKLTQAMLVGILLASSAAHATVIAFVHGRNDGTPTATEGCDYFGGCTSAGNNGASTFHGAGSFSDKSGYWDLGWTATDPIVRYNASVAWWRDASSSDPVCQLANQLNATGQTSIHALGHSAGGLVIAGLLTDAANGWGAGCGTGAVTSAANRITMVAMVATPLRGTKVANAVYGHMTSNGSNPLADFFHNLCGNTVGSLANLLFDQASDMTYYLQEGQVNTSYMSNLNGKTTYLFRGTSTSNGESGTALSAASSCAGLGSNDGLVEEWSARACSTTSCSAKISGYTTVAGEAYAAINHGSNRKGTYPTSSNSYGHSHAMSDMIYWHFGAF